MKTGPLVLKSVPVTGAAVASPWTNQCAPLFSRTHYWHEVGILKVSIYLEARVVCTVQSKMKYPCIRMMRGKYILLMVFAAVCNVYKYILFISVRMFTTL